MLKNRLLRNGSVALGLMLSSSVAFSADGCKFLLCMGAPNPMGVAECADTVREVLHDLSRGRGLPSCTLASGLSTKSEGSWVDYRNATLVPMCPEGYSQGSDGVLYHSGQMPANMRPRSRQQGGVISSKTSGRSLASVFGGNDYQARSCVKGRDNGSIPAYRYQRNIGGGDSETVNVPRQEWRDATMLMTPDGAKYDFTFYVDNVPFSQHRF